MIKFRENTVKHTLWYKEHYKNYYDINSNITDGYIIYNCQIIIKVRWHTNCKNNVVTSRSGTWEPDEIIELLISVIISVHRMLKTRLCRHGILTWIIMFNITIHI